MMPMPSSLPGPTSGVADARAALLQKAHRLAATPPRSPSPQLKRRDYLQYAIHMDSGPDYTQLAQVLASPHASRITRRVAEGYVLTRAELLLLEQAAGRMPWLE